MIGLSPLPSAHPNPFQRKLVRTSTACYSTFILAKGRSLGFASTATNYKTPCSDSLSLRLHPSRGLTWLVTVTRRLIMQKARCHQITWLQPLVSAGFQVLFTPVCPVLFTFPSRYYFTIGLPGVFSLGGWCRQFQTGRLRPRPTQDPTTVNFASRTGLSPALARFPTRLQSRH